MEYERGNTMNTMRIPAAAGASDNLYDPTIGRTLKALLDRYGVALLGESARLRGLLHDECPHAKREISVLLQALDERVPQDLLRVHSGEPIQSLSPRLAKRLEDEKSISGHASRWAINTWAQGLGLESALGAPVPEPSPSAPARGTAQDAPPVAAANDRLMAALAALPKRWLPALAAVVVAALALWYFILRPVLEVTDVSVPGPFVGDGKPRTVNVAFRARNTGVQSLEVRYLRGDGSWTPPQWSQPITPEAASQGQVSLGTLAYKTDRPMSTTFEYVLVSRDGKRSAPFEHTLSIVPPVTIDEIKVPRLLVGRKFALTIRYHKSTSDIVQVQRRVVQSDVPWDQQERTESVKLTEDSGSFDYRFDAPARPQKSTVEFSLADAQGLRSDPVRVVLDVRNEVAAQPPISPTGVPATVVAVRDVRRPAQATGLGAVLGGVIGGLLGSRFGHGSGRTATTVIGAGGGAVAGHEIEKSRTVGGWETTVRFDNGSTQVIAQQSQPRWTAGDRVIVANGTIVGHR
jgi:outer membrane lipoprotein SlyB